MKLYLAGPMRGYEDPAMLSCDAIALLPGWGNSTGATIEIFVARKCGMKIYWASTLSEVDEVMFDG